jgi:hypothetical protein
MGEEFINPNAKCPGTPDVQKAILKIAHKEGEVATIWLYGGFVSCWQERIGGPTDIEKQHVFPGRFDHITYVSIHEQGGDAFVWTDREATRLFPPRHMESYPGVPRDPDDEAVKINFDQLKEL